MGAAWRTVAAVCGSVLLVLVVLHARGAEGDLVAEGPGTEPGEVDVLLEAGVDGLLADSPSDVVEAVARSAFR